MLFVGIAGGSGSGKSSLAVELCKGLDSRCSLLSLDSYYRSRSKQMEMGRTQGNYDHPDALDFSLLVNHLSLLRMGKPIKAPIYDFEMHDRTNKVEIVNPNPVVIVEGIHALWDERLRDIYSLSLFIDVDADLRLMRRAKRDVSSRGRTIESVFSQYELTVREMHKLYVEPTRRYADIVVTNAKNKTVLNLLISYLGSQSRIDVGNER